MAETDTSTTTDTTTDADDTTDEGVQPDGTVGAPDDPTRKGWVWVENDLGRRFDLHETAVPHTPGVKAVPGVPIHYGDRARQPKERAQLGELTADTKAQQRARRR